MKHYRLEDFHKDNYRHYVEEPDSNFSPERNYAIINQTIVEYEKMRYSIDPRVKKAAGDRADILASYGIYRFNKGTKKIEDYLGREWMARIYGEQLMERIRNMEAIQRLNIKRGNTKFKDFYLK